MPFASLESQARLWAADTPRSSYVIGIDTDPDNGDVIVRQRYWGPRLSTLAVREAASLTAARHVTSFSRPAEVEELLPFDGGLRWGVPSLQATVDGIRSLELRFVTASAHPEGGADRLDITLEDRVFPVEVVLSVRVFDDSDVIERWTTLRHRPNSRATVEITRLDSGSWFIPDAPDFHYRAVFGAWAEENQLQRGPLPVGELTFTSRQGITGHHANPWIMIDDGTSGEGHGDIWSVALAWSGSWRMTATRRPDGGAAVTAGFGHDGVRWHVPAGGELTTPPILGLYTAGGAGDASRSWHHHIRRHVLPDGDRQLPVIYNSWEGTGFMVTEPTQLQLAHIAAEMGIELFVVDDGWFGNRDNDRTSLGDWYPHKLRFPAGLASLFDSIRSLGLKTGLWVEPEGISPDSDLYRAHPDWVLHLAGRQRDYKRHQLVLNFARSDVCEWAFAWLDQLVTDLGLDYLKWDMNRPFTQAGWPEQAEGQDRVWIEHTRKVYDVMARLRSSHPQLIIEGCAAGGGRLDLGILRHTDLVWPSDNTDPVDRQTAQHGFCHLYPPNVMSAWVTDSPNANVGRHTPLRYRFHVAMAGVLGVGGHLTEWTAEEREQARMLIAEYKAVRKTIQQGSQYRLGGRPGTWPSAIQYVLDDEVVVLVYNPHGNVKSGPRWLRLTALDPDAIYEVVSSGASGSKAGRLTTSSRWHGSTLMAVGIRPAAWEPIGEDYRSDLIILRRLPG